MKALILVDIQNDFVPGGALSVPHGNEIIPLVNEIIHYPFDVVIATKDWHPSTHGSFANNHGKQPGEHVQLAGLDQILWPAHCIQGQWGSEFAPGWDITEIDHMIYKGTDSSIDSYSTFFDNGHRKSTGLEFYLTDKGIKELFFAGLATDYCVKYSVIDALELGFRVHVIVDACRGIDLMPGDVQKSLELMRKGGAVLLSFKDLKDLMEDDRKRGAL